MGFFSGYGSGGNRPAEKGYRHSRASKFFPEGSHGASMFQVKEGGRTDRYDDWVDDNITTAQYLFSGNFKDDVAVEEAKKELRQEVLPQYEDMMEDYDNMKSVYDGAKRLNDSLVQENQTIRKQYNDLYQTVSNLQRQGSPLGTLLQNIGGGSPGVTQVQKMLSPASYVNPTAVNKTLGGMNSNNLIGNVWNSVLRNENKNITLP